MEKGFVQLPLERYHEIQKLQSELNEAKRDLLILERKIKNTYSITTERSFMSDPLNPGANLVKVRIDKEKFATLLEIPADSHNLELKFFLI